MTEIGLKSLTVTDFRSISGTVTIPLDGPIVLIHGLNGAGKSSILSALELALTGRAGSLPSSSPKHARHLVHRGRDSADVSLTVATEDGEQLTQRVSVRPDGSIDGQALLSADDRRLFLERCYLPQSLVGRLLDIYQKSEGGDSALTTFVKELLGLDRLEALLDGLHPAGDIRRLRHVMGGLKDLESEAKRLADVERDASYRETEARQEVEAARATAVDAWLTLFPDSSSRIMRMSAEELAVLEGPEAPPSAPAQLLALRQELAGLAEGVATLPTSEQQRIEELEARARRASDALDSWRQNGGAQLESLLQRLQDRYPSLDYAPEKGASSSLDAAKALLDSEERRLAALLENQRIVHSSVESTSEELRKCRERIDRLAESFTSDPQDMLEIADLVTTILPHVIQDTCPVCSRDFSEVSDVSLRDHLIQRVSALNVEAKRLQDSSAALQEARRLERSLISRLSQMQITQMSALEFLRITEELASIQSEMGAFEELAPLAESLESLTTEEREARVQLLDERNSLSRSSELRQAAQKIASTLGMPPITENESLGSALFRLTTEVAARLDELDRSAAGRGAIEAARLVTASAVDRLIEQQTELKAAARRARQYRIAFQEFEQRVDLVRRLAGRAEQERTSAVREVFTNSLNEAWRDLFVRLVPSEPFIPAFRIGSTSNGKVTAELETRHRSGGVGGNPTYMLSAGNLNTAAITLFLALNLSVNPKLPWIIFDDPVQSMDEVHISQFAALLRTLSKQQGKAVILAVHERSLFDYLTLELSPAFTGDRLVTVELSRDEDGSTQAMPSIRVWQGDSALHAV